MAWLKRFIETRDTRGLFVLAGMLFALPLGWEIFTGISIWLSPFAMLNSILVLRSVVWLNSLALIPLVLIFLRKRWFCRYICPLGWGCDLISVSRKGRGLSIKRIPPIGRWLAISSLAAALFGLPLFMLLDPMAIFNSFFAIFTKELSLPGLLTFLGLPVVLALNLVFPGIWCSKLCPLGGLQDEITAVKNLSRLLETKEKGKRTVFTTGRRLFLVSGAGVIGGLLLPSFLKPGKKNYLKPPGSLPADNFNTLCLRCGNCIKSCPTGILRHHMDPNEVLSWMVPEIHFNDAYCLESCNTCSLVCPSGAISLFNREAKDQLILGMAVIMEAENCLLSRNKECDRCKAACPYDAITIEPLKGGAFQMLPVVNPDKCVGCGACVVICPPKVIRVVPL